MKEGDIVNVLVPLEEEKQLARIDRPPVLGLCMEHVCPVDENQRPAFEIEKWYGHFGCYRTSHECHPEHMAVLK